MSEINSDSAPLGRDELRKSILSAVSGKEDVISSFKGTKKNKVTVDSNIEPRRFGLMYLVWNFLGGLFFGAGLLVMIMINVLVLSNFDAVRAVTDVFNKLIALLQSMGK